MAGAGLTCKRSILHEFYSKSQAHHRSDNCVLKVWIEVTLLEGDPVFKRRVSPSHPVEDSELMPPPPATLSLNNMRSGGTRAPSTPTNRTSSTFSHASKSWISQASEGGGHSGQENEYNEHRKYLEATRVDPMLVVAEILSKFGLEMPISEKGEESSSNSPDEEVLVQDAVEQLTALQATGQQEEEENREDVGLRLYVNKDGTATLGSRSSDRQTLSSRSSRPDTLSQ